MIQKIVSICREMKYGELNRQVVQYAERLGVNVESIPISVSLAPMEDDTNLIRYNGEVSEVVLHQGEIVLSIDGFKAS